MKRVFLVDVLADHIGVAGLRDGLRAAFESDRLLKVMHDCRQDSDALFHLAGIKLDNVFDVQVCCYLRLFRFVSLPSLSLIILFMFCLCCACAYICCDTFSPYLSLFVCAYAHVCRRGILFCCRNDTRSIRGTNPHDRFANWVCPSALLRCVYCSLGHCVPV